MPTVRNHSEDLARPRERKGGSHPPITKGESLPSDPYAAADHWCEIAKWCYESVKVSGQHTFYQQSDWAMLWLLCDQVHEYQTMTWKDGTSRRSPEMLKAILSGMSSALMTEGDRRRVRIELAEPPKRDDASLHLMQDYRAGLGLSPESSADEPEEGTE